MALILQAVRSSRERRDFFRLPQALHRGDPIWTPAIRVDLQRSLSDRNPLWQEGRGERQLFMAYDGGQPVGRILAHVHHASNELHGERAGFFGLLEVPAHRPDAGRALLEAAAGWHRAAGRTVLRGPYELTITQLMGAVTEGFDEPAALSQGWNPPHLPPLLESAGFAPCYLASTHRLDDVASVDPASLLGDKQRAWLARPGVCLRTWDMEHFERDLVSATELLNLSFKSNWGFVPMSRAEVDFFAAPMKRVVKPEITVFLELDGRPVGVAMALPDLNGLARRMGGELFPFGWATFLAGSRSLDAAVVQFLATSPELQNHGLMRVVLAELFRRLQRSGFRTLDGTWIGDVNAKSLAQVKALGMRQKHRLAVYQRSL